MASAVLLAGCGFGADPATNVTDGTATLNAHVRCDGGKPTPCEFRWRWKPKGSADPYVVGPLHGPYVANTGGTMVAVHEDVRGLRPATTYSVQLGGRGDGASSTMWFDEPDLTTLPNTSLVPPIRAVFAYPWYPETWGPSPTTYTHYAPARGFYSYDTNAALPGQQVADMLAAKQQGGIASWWSPGSRTDSRIHRLLDAAQGTPFRWALYYECEGNTGGGCPVGSPDPSEAQIESDLQYVKDNYAGDAAYMLVAGKPVMFVYNANDTTCAVADRWTQAAAAKGFFVVLKVFAGYRACASQPDGWHQYSPAVRIDRQSGYSTSISPGFFKGGEATPRLARDMAAFRQAVRDMVASGAPWQLLVSFNEWGEGSQIEAAPPYDASYITALSEELP